jgi:hypothetical protein
VQRDLRLGVGQSSSSRRVQITVRVRLLLRVASLIAIQLHFVSIISFVR